MHSHYINVGIHLIKYNAEIFFFLIPFIVTDCYLD